MFINVRHVQKSIQQFASSCLLLNVIKFDIILFSLITPALVALNYEQVYQPSKKSFHHSGEIPVEFHWSPGKLLENDWNKWNLWNSSGIPAVHNINSP